MSRNSCRAFEPSALAWAPGCALAALLVSGCGTEPSAAAPLSETEATSALVTRRMPDPVVWRIRPESLDAAGQKRRDEVDRFHVAQHASHRIVTTTQGYSGDIYDWVDADTIPGSHATPPSVLPRTQGSLLTELEAFPELRGPSGTVPILRQTFPDYVRGTVSAPSLSAYIHGLPPGQPASSDGHQHAGFKILSTPNHGGHTSMNAFPGTTETGTFTLLEEAVTCVGANPATDLEMVGAALARGVNSDGSTLRFDTEFWTAGYKVGGWDMNVSGWVPYAGAPFSPGVQVAPVSVPGGAQTEVGGIYVQKNSAGWWIAYAGQWLGYYPSSLFSHINSYACEIQWYGEVFDPSPTNWTTDDMGEGGFASQGFGWASYFHDVWFFSTNDNAYLAGSGNATMMTSNDPRCYTASAWNAGPQLGNYPNWFYVGGPGHTSTNGCN